MPEGAATHRLCRMCVGAAMAAVMAAAGGCAADDELLVPRPTVPSVTAAPTPTSDPRAEETGTVDPAPPGLDDQAQTGSQESGQGEPAPEQAGPEQAAPELAAPAAPSPEPESAEAGQEQAGPRPDGNMFAAEVDAEVVLTLDEPIDLAVAPGDDLVWVAERAGLVSRVAIERGEVVETVLDITSETRAAGEQGLLGIAVTDRWLYANFTDLAGDTQVVAFEREGTGLSDRRRTILTQRQPFSNHNGGDLAIGGDGLLYIGFGDGGSGGDPLNAGQDATTWLGAVLRIEPTPEGVEPYNVPPDNPFVAGEGQSAGGRPEIFLIGVRNPWRFSFDRDTGDLWIADVGQDSYEEVTVLLAGNGGGLGANLGWRLREGLHYYAGEEPPGHADPVWEYGQDDGCSVTGGFVYRGSAIEDLYGAYVFGDYCTSRLWAVQFSTGEVEFRDLGVEVPGGSLASFGEDARGELYTLSLNGPVARIVPR